MAAPASGYAQCIVLSPVNRQGAFLLTNFFCQEEGEGEDNHGNVC